ncbi:MAG: TniB family NTP-binding protein [Bacillus sp. (in: firmicutes)]
MNNEKYDINYSNISKEAELRRTVEREFHYKKTKAFLIDEAQHFFEFGGNRKNLIGQFNSIRSFTNMVGTKLVLFGRYDLNYLINIDGQLTRKVKEIHFPRYDIRIEEDANSFENVVYSFQKVLPLEEEPNLIEHTMFLYEYSIGCVGILKEWLERCLTDALNSGDKTITIEHLKKNALSIKIITTLAKEAVKGESVYKEREEDKIKLQKMLMGP